MKINIWVEFSKLDKIQELLTKGWIEYSDDADIGNICNGNPGFDVKGFSKSDEVYVQISVTYDELKVLMDHD